MRRNSFGRTGSRPRIPASMRWHILTLLASTAYLYANLFASPRFPYLLGGDQLYFWMGAQRLLDGQAIYRDFFQYTPPGIDLVFALSFQSFANTILAANAVTLILGLLSAWLCFSLATQLMKDTQALFATASFLIVFYGKFLNATHHWFAVFFILLAVRLCLHQITVITSAIAGMLLAIAAFFNHVHAAAALFAFIAFFILRSVRRPITHRHTTKLIAALVLPCLAALFCLYAHYLGTIGFEPLWACLVTSVHRYVGTYPGSLGLPGPLSFSTSPYLAVYLLLPITYATSLTICWRLRKDPRFPWNQVTLLSLTGLALLLDVAVSINIVRAFAIAMPAIILFVWLTCSFLWQPRSLLLCASIAVTAIALVQIAGKHRACTARLTLPGGSLATTPQSADKLRLLAHDTRPGDYFLQSGWPGVYLPLQLKNPLSLPTLSQWDYIYPEDIQAAIRQMEAKHAPYVLWTHSLDEQCNFLACRDQLSPFRAYLVANFSPVHDFADGDTLWQRTASPHKTSDRTSGPVPEQHPSL